MAYLLNKPLGQPGAWAEFSRSYLPHMHNGKEILTLFTGLVCGLSEKHEQVPTSSCVTVTMMSIPWDNVQNRIQDLRESQISGKDVNAV